ncbi:hypothetical protein M9Y10_032124 [Tritrichomonas musculus]|uniref:SecA DEAD-like N-terminal domain-containing protein n=1 Tax=Tritrichomonas musculus TaxID=1915356 RepID=A0ABR2H103_9EUKA
MPILDPSLQCFLVQNITETEGKDGYAFILKYLKIASRNIFRNLNTIETSIKFKKDFELSILSINKLFKCDFKAHELGKSYQRNCYKYFFKHINYINKEEESKKYRGIYRICNDKFNTIFFQPCVFYSKYHSWFFTDTPIAILAIDSEKFISIPMAKTKIMQIIKIEIDLLSASGLTLVLCFNYTPDTIDFFKQIIQDDQFSEIHCNIFKDSNIKSFLQNFQNISHFFRGYFYLYCHFTEKKSEEQLLMKELKKNPRTFISTFSMSPQKVLTKLEFIQTKPFSHCKSGFKYDHLRIFLSYVPLYDSESIDESFIPSVVSSLCLGYISPSDFLRMSSKRVKILFDDDMNRHHHTIKYVSSENIHSVRSDLFVEDALLLTKMEKEEIQTISKIKTRVDMKIMNDKKFHKKYLFKLLKDKKYKECLQYVTFAYSHYIRSSIPDFMIHKAQIYAAFEACKTCFHTVKNKNEDGPKGVIYQVETGEGKSCIICLIAAVLALKKYTVHIASSNIKLSNRDYYCSYEFIKLLGLKSAVLLHKNELPFQTKLHEEDDQQDQIPLKDLYHIEEDSYFKSNADYYYKINTMKSNEEYKKNYPKEFFGDDLFKNPSKMNFPICGISNNNLETKTKAKIIFSTFVNFECFYLHLMEMCPGYIDRYFKKCSLLVDEADSILIDEIQNGTIVAREIKSNAKEILSLVYFCCIEFTIFFFISIIFIIIIFYFKYLFVNRSKKI